MAWTNKSKTSALLQRGRLLTPDGNQILVGSSVDEVLIYQEFGDSYSEKGKTVGSWSKKSKTVGSWSNKNKI